MAHSLSDKQLERDPIKLFGFWFRLVEDSGSKLPNVMCLSTVSQRGKPSARMVLLKEFGANGFVFYTNLKSQKGKEIQDNPNVSLTFYWKELDRQIRIEGKAKKVSREMADQYFSSRPREYQISAWASTQSEILDSRRTLLRRYAEFEKRFRRKEVPRPRYWSGFIVVPLKMEFWENQPNRLHDRMSFSRKGEKGIWKIARLYP